MLNWQNDFRVCRHPGVGPFGHRYLKGSLSSVVLILDPPPQLERIRGSYRATPTRIRMLLYCSPLI